MSDRNDVSKKYADELGSRQPKDKKDVFGKSLNEKDRRFYGLRESGYKGWIDQDGYMK